MKYRTPRADREYAAWPAVRDMPEMARHNSEILSHARASILGVPFPEFAGHCRRELLDAARAYAQRMRLPCPADSASPIVATGHQGEFFHAGVWIKNHLAFRLGRFLRGTSLNLIVDNDVPKHLGLLLPDLTGEAPHRVIAPLGEPQSDTAYEEHPSDFPDPEGFSRLALETVRGKLFDDNARRLAERIVAARGRGSSMGDVSTVVRAQYEHEAGVTNAELPVSSLCETESFLAFAAAICLDAAGFAAAHNEAVRRYRQAHHMRRATNPVPDLQEGPPCEAPFWVWRNGQARQRLFVAREAGGLRLFAGNRELLNTRIADPEDVAAFRTALADRGIKIRPRALSLTLFMRLFGCDLFVHGIGGAQYDEVTDAIIESYYGITPPRYAVITATMYLPWGFAPVDPREATALIRALRDIKHNPDRLIDERNAAQQALVEKKKAIVASIPSDAAGRREKWLAIRALNETLAGRLEALDADTRRRLDEFRRMSLRDAVAFSREYSCFLVGVDAVTSCYREALAPLDV